MLAATPHHNFCYKLWYYYYWLLNFEFQRSAHVLKLQDLNTRTFQNTTLSHYLLQDHKHDQRPLTEEESQRRSKEDWMSERGHLCKNVLHEKNTSTVKAICICANNKKECVLPRLCCWCSERVGASWRPPWTNQPSGWRTCCLSRIRHWSCEADKSV